MANAPPSSARRGVRCCLLSVLPSYCPTVLLSYCPTVLLSYHSLVEVVSEAELQPIHIPESNRRLVGVIDELVVDVPQAIRQPSLCIGAGCGERRRRHDALADAPVVIQQVAEVQDVEPHFQTVLASPHLPPH